MKSLLKRCLTVCFSITLVGGLAATAKADAISVFNTGYDITGTLLTNTTTPDAHWRLVSLSGGGTVTPGNGANPTGPSIFAGSNLPAPWLPNQLTSLWLTPGSNASTTYQWGTYSYETTFALPAGFTDPVLNFQFAADNAVLDVTLNGNTIYTNGTPATSQFDVLSSVQTTNNPAFFATGTNTVRFNLRQGISASDDDLGPTGLQVQINGTFQPVPAPPAAISLGIGGLVGLMGTGIRTLRARRAPKK